MHCTDPMPGKVQNAILSILLNKDLGNMKDLLVTVSLLLTV